MTLSKQQLATATSIALHVDERERFCAFIADEATQFAPNPFAVTTVGVVLQRWLTRRIEFRAFGIVEAGLACLLSCAGTRPETDTLVQEILKAGPYTLYLFHDGDGCRILGGVLHAKPGLDLPDFRPGTRRRRRSTQTQVAQLDLFAATGV